MEKQRFQAKDLLVLLFCVMIMATTMGGSSCWCFRSFPCRFGRNWRQPFRLCPHRHDHRAFRHVRRPVLGGLLLSKTRDPASADAWSSRSGGALFSWIFSRPKALSFYILACAVGLLYGGVSIIPVSTIITRYFTKTPVWR